MAQDEGRDATDQQQSTPLKWTIMVYLAGDNNLSANSVAIMQELAAAAPPGNVRVLACFDSNTPRPRGARYLEINHRRHDPNNPSTINWGLHNDLVPFDELKGHPVMTPDFCNTDPTAQKPPMMEPVAKEGLSRFLTFALKNHPADRYMLILFGHGSAVAGNTFLVDNNPPSFLRLKEFAEVLSRHFDKSHDPSKPKLDILACDNCMMNGVETAFQIKDQVDYILGSQGLMLAVGWPFRKIIRSVIYHQDDATDRVALGVLEACAGDLIDFSLMDRSSEQAICDLTTFDKDKNLATAVKKLVAAMQEGLEFDKRGELLYPPIRDAIRLARLEAQSYWSETFVDLYDFCELLLRRCNKALGLVDELFSKFVRKNLTAPAMAERSAEEKFTSPREIDFIKSFGNIAVGCERVLEAIKGKDEGKEKGCDGEKFVCWSYYIGPQLQYSNGVSIYFPWTLPEGPIIFEPVNGEPGGGGGSGGSYGLSWASFDRLRKPPDDYIFKTAFDEYKDYDFAKCEAGDWAAFLERFFRATLRNVRRFDHGYEQVDSPDKFFKAMPRDEKILINPADLNQQKSSSDTDTENDCACPTIKNYPRRFYVSPADCLRRCKESSRDFPLHNKKETEACVSYLGWNIRGLLARVLKPKHGKSGSSAAIDDSSETGPEREPEES